MIVNQHDLRAPTNTVQPSLRDGDRQSPIARPKIQNPEWSAQRYLYVGFNMSSESLEAREGHPGFAIPVVSRVPGHQPFVAGKS
jgi:hypothetical protein